VLTGGTTSDLRRCGGAGAAAETLLYGVTDIAAYVPDSGNATLALTL
jgi:hypothetical protein